MWHLCTLFQVAAGWDKTRQSHATTGSANHSKTRSQASATILVCSLPTTANVMMAARVLPSFFVIQGQTARIVRQSPLEKCTRQSLTNARIQALMLSSLNATSPTESDTTARWTTPVQSSVRRASRPIRPLLLPLLHHQLLYEHLQMVDTATVLETTWFHGSSSVRRLPQVLDWNLVIESANLLQCQVALQLTTL